MEQRQNDGTQALKQTSVFSRLGGGGRITAILSSGRVPTSSLSSCETSYSAVDRKLEAACNRRRRRQGVRFERHPALSCREDRQIPLCQNRQSAWRTVVMDVLYRLRRWPLFWSIGAFPRYAPEKISYAANRYAFEAQRHADILDARLAKQKFMLGNTYTIVDMNVWGWARLVPTVLGDGAWEKFPNLKRLVDEISARPAAQRAMALKDQHKFKDRDGRRGDAGHVPASECEGRLKRRRPARPDTTVEPAVLLSRWPAVQFLRSQQERRQPQSHC